MFFPSQDSSQPQEAKSIQALIKSSHVAGAVATTPALVNRIYGLAATAHTSVHSPHTSAPQLALHHMSHTHTRRGLGNLPYDLQKEIVAHSMSSAKAKFLDDIWPKEIHADLPPFNVNSPGPSRFNKHVNTLRQLSKSLQHVVDSEWHDVIQAGELIQLIILLKPEERASLKASRLHPEQHIPPPGIIPRTLAYRRLRLLQTTHTKIRSMIYKLDDYKHHGAIAEIILLSSVQYVSMGLTSSIKYKTQSICARSYHILDSFPQLTDISISLQYLEPPSFAASDDMGPISSDILQRLETSFPYTSTWSLPATKWHVVIREWIRPTDLRITDLSPRHISTIEASVIRGQRHRVIALLYTPHWQFFSNSLHNIHSPLTKLVLPPRISYHCESGRPEKIGIYLDAMRQYLAIDHTQDPDAYIQIHFLYASPMEDAIKGPESGRLEWRHKNAIMTLWLNALYAFHFPWYEKEINWMLQRICRFVTTTKRLCIRLDQRGEHDTQRLMQFFDRIACYLQDYEHTAHHFWGREWEIELYTVRSPHSSDGSTGSTESKGEQIVPFYTRKFNARTGLAETEVNIDAYLNDATWANVIKSVLGHLVSTTTQAIQFHGFDPTTHYSPLVRFNQKFASTSDTSVGKLS